MATSLYSQVHLWCQKKYEDYGVFTNSIFFILGLILSYKLVEKTFLNILITILNNAWDDYDLRRAVIVVNFQEGTTSVLVPFFAYAADVHTGRFTMLAISCAVCIIGLVLNCLQSTEYNGRLDVRLFYPALVLMTLAQAAQTVTLQPFLEDQLRSDPTCDGDGDTDTAWGRRSRFWWNLLSFVAAIFAVFGPLARLQFRNLAIALTSLMGFCFLVFLLGTEYYVFVDTIENPFKDVVTVILGAIGKTKLEYPQTPQELFGNSSTGDLHIAPIVPWLRWLDKAAIIKEQEIWRGRAGIPSSVEEVRGVKLLLKMLPLWFTFLTLSLVAASGSTFFLVEAISLSSDNLTPILLFSSLQRLIEFVVSGASSYIIGKLGKRKYNEQKMELVRIAIGLKFCVACCIAAWIAADERMQHESEDRLMSVYLLTPQYVLLGVMRGLCGQGLQSFYKSQVSETLCRFGPPFGEFMMGVGKFTCMLCILIFSPVGWFQKELYNSYLDRYYIFLAFLSYANVVVYMLVTRWYGDDVFLVGDDVQMGTADQADAQLLVDGLASRSTNRSLYRRVVSAPERTGSSGDAMADRPDRPLLTTNNSWRSHSLA